ncbi:MAG: fumarylacetoacetate hydrolase family protein [Flavobacteriales bacterium]|jgi:acylpyruvate hydrolase|nr:fumarylacetoacetate hydrolase family protein [Flavobacteriales bacterium]MDG1175992.1 fumarylacetoacetate hydrolase family protein [Flavobacteriales bacterium]
MKIICIGRNYSEHAKELGNEAPKEPLFFLKPDSAILPKRVPFYIPEFTNDLHYEVELLVKINRLGKHIEERFANEYYSQIGLGIDFTARDLQKECKSKGLPWEKAKAFDGSAIIGKEFIDKSEFESVQDISFSLNKNGDQVQLGNSKDMIFTIDAIISYVSQFFTLKIGDIIYTGTPSGVGPVKIGDKLEGFLGKKQLVSLDIK